MHANIFDSCRDMTVLYQELMGGLGNQLFMLFNLIALSIKYQMKFVVYFDKTKQYARPVKPFSDYTLFSKIPLANNKMDTTHFLTYREKNFKYHKIVLDRTRDYILLGYFQSYKYFWEHRQNIRDYLHICPDILKRIHDFKGTQKFIAVHIRMGDYLLNPDYHCVQNVDYYKNIMDHLDLHRHTILLFSDDMQRAKDYLVTYTYRTADEFSENDEDQLLLMSHCDILVGASSTYSLMSMYLNKIYQFNPESFYCFPHQWFGKKGPAFDMDDLIPQL